MVRELLEKTTLSRLHVFGTVAEEHRDYKAISRAFSDLMDQVSRSFDLPILFRDLGCYAATRIVQAACVAEREITLDKLFGVIGWIPPLEIHRLICQAIEAGVVNARIDMQRNILRVCSE